VSEATEKQSKLWSITVISGEGDEETVEINEHNHLQQLLQKGVKELYGETAKADDYDLVINGVTQTNLQATLTEAGLQNDSEVTILSKDVNRG
jgi:hypothetical protein